MFTPKFREDETILTYFFQMGVDSTPPLINLSCMWRFRQVVRSWLESVSSCQLFFGKLPLQKL